MLNENITPTDLDKQLDINKSDFVDTFNLLIEESHKNWKNKVKENSKYPNIEDDTDANLNNEKRSKSSLKTHNVNIFQDPPSWKPTNGYGSEFDKLKILKHKQLNNWEIHRINLSKRSYLNEKQELLSNGKSSFKYTNAYGKEFEKSFNKEEQKNSLTELGKTIINKFINNNNSKIAESIKIDDQIYQYKHSKPPVELNTWKTIHQIGDYFSTPKADEVHSFKISLKEKFKNQNPFKRPKIYGEYFNKIDLTQEFEKYSIK